MVIAKTVAIGPTGSEGKTAAPEMPETISSDSIVATVCPDDPEAA